jgi:hypothetical protein
MNIYRIFFNAVGPVNDSLSLNKSKQFLKTWIIVDLSIFVFGVVVVVVLVSVICWLWLKSILYLYSKKIVEINIFPFPFPFPFIENKYFRLIFLKKLKELSVFFMGAERPHILLFC